MGATRYTLGLLLLAVSATAEPRTISLDWKHDWKAQYQSGQYKAYINPPEGVEKLEHDDVWYLDVELAPKRILLAAVQTHHEPPRVWIDLDFDGKFTDEKPIDLKESGGRVGGTFPLPWNDAQATRIPTRLIFSKDLDKGSVWLRLSAHREARALLGGRMRRVVAVSGDADLRVDDPDVDFFYVDVDGDGQIDTTRLSHDRVRPGEPFRVGRIGCVLEVLDPTGAQLRLTRSETAPPLRGRVWPAPATLRRPYSRSTLLRRGDTLKELIADYENAKRPGSFSIGGEWQLRKIGGVGSAAAVRFLLSVVKKEKDADLRVAAAEALGYTNNKAHAKHVKKAARSLKDAELAIQLLDSLEAMGATGLTEYYLELLDSARHDIVREHCANRLAADKKSRPTLGAKVGSFRSGAANYYAYKAATRFHPAPPDNQLLSRALQTRDARLRILALADVAWVGRRDTYADIASIAAAELKAKRLTPELARIIVDSLGPCAGAPEIPTLFGAMPVASLETRNRLVDQLRWARGEAMEEAIRAQLALRNPRIRETAVRVVAGLPGEQNSGQLATLLEKERDAKVRLSLVNAVGRGQVQSASPAVIAIAKGKKNGAALREAALVALARIGFASKDVAAHFEKQAADRKWTTRLDAVDIVARYGGTDAVPFLSARLDDAEWRIRVAAAQGLGRIRIKPAISPLIARLDPEKDKRARRAVADALFRITGQHLYDMHNLWLKWWSRNYSSFVVPDEIPTKKKSKAGRRTVANFYGVPVESERITFVIDQSGSMSGWGGGESELDKAVKEVLKVIASMKNGAMINVIFFETGVHSWSKRLVKLTRKSRVKLKSHLLRQQPMGGTNLYDGLERAIKLKGVDTVYLLSDGAPGVGKFVEDDDILREIGKLNKRLRIQIHCISIGSDSDLLKKLAEQTGGSYAKR